MAPLGPAEYLQGKAPCGLQGRRTLHKERLRQCTKCSWGLTSGSKGSVCGFRLIIAPGTWHALFKWVSYMRIIQTKYKKQISLCVATVLLFSRVEIS